MPTQPRAPPQQLPPQLRLPAPQTAKAHNSSLALAHLMPTVRLDAAASTPESARGPSLLRREMVAADSAMLSQTTMLLRLSQEVEAPTEMGTRMPRPPAGPRLRQLTAPGPSSSLGPAHRTPTVLRPAAASTPGSAPVQLSLKNVMVGVDLEMRSPTTMLRRPFREGTSEGGGLLSCKP